MKNTTDWVEPPVLTDEFRQAMIAWYWEHGVSPETARMMFKYQPIEDEC